MTKRHLIFLIATLILMGCDASLNEDIDIAPHSHKAGGATTMNGNVLVGEHAVVTHGDVKTVNGRIDIREGAEVRDCATVNGSVSVGAAAKTGTIETVNGDLWLDEDAHVDGDIRLVNGGVILKHGVTVDGDVGTVNGSIELHGATVKGELVNYQGGMTITTGSLVEGGLIIREALEHDEAIVPRIIIGPDAEVRGTLKFERPVQLFIHETALTGEIDGATPIAFSGDLPGPG